MQPKHFAGPSFLVDEDEGSSPFGQTIPVWQKEKQTAKHQAFQAISTFPQDLISCLKCLNCKSLRFSQPIHTAGRSQSIC